LWASILKAEGIFDQNPVAISFKNNSLYLCGEEFETEADFQNPDPRPASYFIAKYADNGGKTWSKNIFKAKTISDSFKAYDIATDSSGTTYVCGIYGIFGEPAETVDFGNGVNIAHNSRQNAFILQSDSNGTALSAAIIHSTTGNVSQSVATDREGNAVLCGYYRGVTAFRNDLELTGSDGGEMYIAKYGDRTVSSVDNAFLKNADFSIHPNPAHDLFRISLKTTCEIRTSLTNILGREFPLKQEDLITNENIVECNIADIPAGVYVLKVETGNQIFTQKLIIQK